MGQDTLDSLAGRLAELELKVKSFEAKNRKLEADIELLRSSLKVRDEGVLAVQEQLFAANKQLKKLRAAVREAEANLSPLLLLAAQLETKFKAAAPEDPSAADFAEMAGTVSLVLDLLDRATKDADGI